MKYIYTFNYTINPANKMLQEFVEEKQNNIIKNIFIKDESNNLNSLLPQNSSAKNNFELNFLKISFISVFFFM